MSWFSTIQARLVGTTAAPVVSSSTPGTLGANLSSPSAPLAEAAPTMLQRVAAILSPAPPLDAYAGPVVAPSTARPALPPAPTAAVSGPFVPVVPGFVSTALVQREAPSSSAIAPAQVVPDSAQLSHMEQDHQENVGRWLIYGLIAVGALAFMGGGKIGTMRVWE